MNFWVTSVRQHFAEIIDAENNRDPQAGQPADLRFHRTVVQHQLQGRPVEKGPGKDDLDEDAGKNQTVAKQATVQAGAVPISASDEVVDLHQEDGGQGDAGGGTMERRRTARGC